MVIIMLIHPFIHQRARDLATLSGQVGTVWEIYVLSTSTWHPAMVPLATAGL